MNWLSRLLTQFNAWLRKFFLPNYRTRFIEGDLPARLDRKVIYIVKEDGFLEYAAMLCPCGCGQVLYMNLIPDERPCWYITEHPSGTVTLHPSVWRNKGCQSHFWFREGQIYWCEFPQRS